jgi:hypothetical protein
MMRGFGRLLGYQLIDNLQTIFLRHPQVQHDNIGVMQII